MADFFSEFLHVSQVYTIATDDKSPANEAPKPADQDPPEQVLISQRTRKCKEQDQIQEIIDLYTKDKDDPADPDEPSGPTFDRIE